MPTTTSSSGRTSPLDPFLVRFLAAVETRDQGFYPGVESAELATDLDLPRAFIDGLYTSARTRGLLKPRYGRGSRVRWGVSPSGRNLMELQDRLPASEI